MQGIKAALEILAAAGVRHLFGNPGTTELPLNAAAASDSRFRYILGLHEIPVMSMADGFAMASGGIGFVNLHGPCGLGNAMGMLYNAHIEGTPLVVTAGEQDRRLIAEEPVLAGDTVRMARPLTKWSAKVDRVEDLPILMRRALQIALAPPTGPVFLSLPLDVQMEWSEGLDVRGPSILDRRVRPPKGVLESAAQRLLTSRRPAIIAGSRVTAAGGAASLAALAELLGAPVYSEATPSHGRLPMAPHHPLYAGPLASWAPELSRQLADYDTLLAVGINVFRLYIYDKPERVVAPEVTILHLDNMAYEIGKNYGVDIGMLGDPACGLEELGIELARMGDSAWRSKVAQRTVEYTQRHQMQRATHRNQVDAEFGATSMTAHALMGAIARVFPAEGAVVEEAITTHHNLFEHLEVVRDPAAFFAHRGWALGWGMGCALGVQLAWPERPTLALIGDGSSLYGLQALWSAARYQIPVTFVIANNRQYKILKVCGDMLALDRLHHADCEGLDLQQPNVNFLQLASAFGVQAERADNCDAVSDLVRSALGRGVPQLIEVPIM